MCASPVSMPERIFRGITLSRWVNCLSLPTICRGTKKSSSTALTACGVCARLRCCGSTVFRPARSRVGSAGGCIRVDLYARLQTQASAEGFPLFGAVDLAPLLDDPKSRFYDHLRRYDEWLADGFAGEMHYLERGRDRRADPRRLFPGAQSIACFGFPYTTLAQGAEGSDTGPRYARYLQGPDYHQDLVKRLKRLCRTVFPKKNVSDSPPYKICVDTSAVLERTWAYLCGLGFLGKNSMLIHPRLGSYFFIGSVLLQSAVDRPAVPRATLCGQCQRCLRQCPTQAIVAPGRVDARRCIAYLTLESRERLPPPPNTGSWVAGCDICQEVCPFNFRAVAQAQKDTASMAEAQTSATELHDWVALLQETPLQYAQRVEHSALRRMSRAQFSRNLAQALQQAVGSLHPALFPILAPLVRARLAQSEEIAHDAWVRCAQAIDLRMAEL